MEDPLDIFKDLSEEIEEKPSLFKKIFIFSISILLLILVLSYFLTSPGIRNSFVGLIESSTIKDNIISINSTNKIIFEKNIYQELINYYDQNKEKEFKVCLMGIFENGDYFINEMYKPEMVSQTYTQVVSKPCPSDTLIDMHSHPYRHCLASNQDLKTFERFKINNPNVLMAIMCEKGRFNFYN